MHRKVTKNQLGRFSLQATAFVSVITKMFWGTAQAVTPMKTPLVFNQIKAKLLFHETAAS